MVQKLHHNNNLISVHSIFTSIQGEGIDSGRPTLFIRLSGCPFRCPFCDEKEALIYHNGAFMNFEELGQKIFKNSYGNELIIEFTGGSPEWQESLYNFVAYYRMTYGGIGNLRVTIQASGGIEMTEDELKLFNCVKVDYKHKKDCGFDMNFRYDLLSANDEIKLIASTDEDGLLLLKETILKLMKKSNFGPRIIVTSMTSANDTVESEIEKWKKVTEFIINDETLRYNASNIQVLPRLQQLYWHNQKSK